MGILQNPPPPGPSGTAVPAGPSSVVAVVTLAFDPVGVVASSSGRLDVGEVRVEGADTVVLTLPGLGRRAQASVIGGGAVVRVAGETVVYTVPGGLPQGGTALVLLTQPQAGKRAQNSLAPAPPGAIAYLPRIGEPGGLSMTVDGRTQGLRVEATDAPPAKIEEASWQTLQTVAVVPALPFVVDLMAGEDPAGRRFRTVALRYLGGDILESAPSAVVYANRMPVSAGDVAARLALGDKGLVSLAPLVTDPDGGEMTYRVATRGEIAGRDGLPSWITLSGSTLAVDTSAVRAPASLLVVGVDELGWAATCDLTVSVYNPAVAAPTGVAYVTDVRPPRLPPEESPNP